MYVPWNITQPKKKEEIVMPAATWVKREDVMLREPSQSQEDKRRAIALM